jgi:hypothetical protein
VVGSEHALRYFWELILLVFFQKSRGVVVRGKAMYIERPSGCGSMRYACRSGSYPARAEASKKRSARSRRGSHDVVIDMDDYGSELMNKK